MSSEMKCTLKVDQYDIDNHINRHGSSILNSAPELKDIEIEYFLLGYANNDAENGEYGIESYLSVEALKDSERLHREIDLEAKELDSRESGTFKCLFSDWPIVCDYFAKLSEDTYYRNRGVGACFKPVIFYSSLLKLKAAAKDKTPFLFLDQGREKSYYTVNINEDVSAFVSIVKERSAKKIREKEIAAQKRREAAAKKKKEEEEQKIREAKQLLSSKGLI